MREVSWCWGLVEKERGNVVEHNGDALALFSTRVAARKAKAEKPEVETRVVKLELTYYAEDE